MKLSKIEVKILLELYNLCEYTLIEEIPVPKLYPKFKDKNYLWITIKKLEQRDILESEIKKGIKIISLTDKGEKITKALRIIEIQSD